MKQKYCSVVDVNCKKTKPVLTPGPSLLRKEGGNLLRKEEVGLLRKEESDGEGIEVRFDVDPALVGIVSHFYVIRTGENEPVRISHLSPNLEMMVVFNFGQPIAFSYGDARVGQHTMKQVGILGPLRKMMNYELKPGSDLLILHFVYNGFYRFLSLPPEDIAADLATEEALYAQTQTLQTIWEKLRALNATEQRIELVNSYLVNTVSASHPASLPLLESVEQIHDTTVDPVKHIAAKASITERSVQLRFKKYTGYSSKELLRFLRFKQVLTFIIERPTSKINWFDLIVQYGYHDQSHLIKDFKYYTGVTPRQFMKLNDEGNLCVSRE